jgi:outer membrane lipoprotein carrier protein
MLRYSTLALLVAGLAGCGGGSGSPDPAAGRDAPAGQPPGSAPAADAGETLPPVVLDDRGDALPLDAAAEGSTAVAPAAGSPGAPGGSATTGGSGTAPGAAPAPASPQAAADARQIMERVERTYAGIRSMEADFVQQLRVPLLGSDQQSRGRFFQRQPDRLLMRFSDPAGDVIVADGRHLWMYYPSIDRAQVLRASLAQGGGSVDFQREFLQNSTQRYAATLVGEEVVDGRPAHVLNLVPRAQSTYRSIRIWVDQQESLVRRFEVTEQNDSQRRIEFRNIRRNVALDDAIFRFTVPQGAQVFDQ